MPALQIRDVPEDVYQDLVALAKKEHRSINQQALFMLRERLYLQLDSQRQEVVHYYTEDQIAQAQYKTQFKKLKQKYYGQVPRKWPDGVPTPTEMIREDRDSR